MGHQKVRLHVGDDRKRCNATAKKPWKITGCARSNRARCAYGLIAQLEELLRPKEWVGGSNPSEITFLIFVQNIIAHGLAIGPYGRADERAFQQRASGFHYSRSREEMQGIHQ